MTTETPDRLDGDTRNWLEERRRLTRQRLFEKSVPDEHRGVTLGDLSNTRLSADLRAWLASDSLTLFLVGGKMAGKSHAAYATLRSASGGGANVWGATVADLACCLPDAAPDTRLRKVAGQVDLLLLDDLRPRLDTVDRSRLIGRLLDERVGDRKRQIITGTAATVAELIDGGGWWGRSWAESGFSTVTASASS